VGVDGVAMNRAVLALGAACLFPSVPAAAGADHLTKPGTMVLVSPAGRDRAAKH